MDPVSAWEISRMSKSDIPNADLHASSANSRAPSSDIVSGTTKSNDGSSVSTMCDYMVAIARARAIRAASPYATFSHR